MWGGTCVMSTRALGDWGCERGIFGNLVLQPLDNLQPTSNPSARGKEEIDDNTAKGVQEGSGKLDQSAARAQVRGARSYRHRRGPRSQQFKGSRVLLKDHIGQRVPRR